MNCQLKIKQDFHFTIIFILLKILRAYIELPENMNLILIDIVIDVAGG